MQVTVNVEDINLADVINQYTDQTLAEALVEKLTLRIVQDDSYKGIAERVRQIRDEEIRAALTPVIAAALAEPIHPTNAWGEKTGTLTTLREVIIAEARKWMDVKGERGYGSREDGLTNLQRMIRDEVRAGFENEIKAMVTEARNAVSKQIGTTVAVAVQSAVNEGLRAAR